VFEKMNWRQDAARTSRLEACATAVAQASCLLVHGASQLRVPVFAIFRQTLRQLARHGSQTAAAVTRLKHQAFPKMRSLFTLAATVLKEALKTSFFTELD
jgi:hypothetical protein